MDINSYKSIEVEKWMGKAPQRDLKDLGFKKPES